MNPIYEYIAAVFVITLVVGYSIYSFNTMSSSQLAIAHEEQLQPVAERLLNKILLTKGYPEDWGSNIDVENTSLADFGLSSQFGEIYQVDADKLLRLVGSFKTMTNPRYIDPTIMGNLTGIYENDSWSYGFRLVMKNALNISINYVMPDAPGGDKIDPPPSIYFVEVTNYLEKGLSNVEINATLFLLYADTKKSDEYYYNYTATGNVTNWQGRAILDFGANVPTPITQQIQGKPEYAYVIIITAAYYGIQSQYVEVVRSTTPPLDLLIQGQYLIANFEVIPSIKNIPHGANHLDPTAILFTSNQQLIFNDVNESKHATDVINHGGKQYAAYELKNPVTDDIIFAGCFVMWTGHWTLVLCTRTMLPATIDYRSHSFESAGLNSEIFSRLVRFGSNSYYAELTVWRMSE